MSLSERRGRPDTWLAAVTALILRVALVAALGYFLFRVGFIIVVVVMAMMLSLTVAPLVLWLERSPILRRLHRHARRAWSAGLVFTALAFVLFELGVVMFRPLAQEFGALWTNWGEHQAQLMSSLRSVQDRWDSLPLEVREYFQKSWGESQKAGDLGSILTEQLSHVGLRTVEGGKVLVELILIPVLAFSFLTEGRPLKREMAVIFPVHRVKEALRLSKQVGIILQSYAIGQLILALIAGVAVWILLTSLGIRYALALAVVAAVTRVIPVIGPLVGGVPIVLISVLQGWDRGAIVLIAFSLLHLVESKVVMPRIIGYRIKLHPAMVIVALLIGAEFFGMWGMFLAAPFAAVARTLFLHFFVRPVKRGASAGGPPSSPPRSQAERKETQVERPAVAGVRHHSGAH